MNKEEVHRAVEALETEFANFGTFVLYDAHLRSLYSSQISEMATQLTRQVGLGQLTWEQAASMAQRTRNLIMDLTRRSSSPVGRAMAEMAKTDGYTLNQMIGIKTTKMYGSTVIFKTLSTAQQDRLFASIVKSAGKSNASVDSLMHGLPMAGRSLIFLSLGLSIYDVATSEDPYRSALVEGSTQGAGILGGMTGGFLAGLACGPGAPVCVTAGAFAGGALAAFGMQSLW